VELETPNVTLGLLIAHPVKNITYDMQQVRVYYFVNLSQSLEYPGWLLLLLRLLNKERSDHYSDGLQNKGPPDCLPGQRVSVYFVKVKETR
jgi:hypothetical protein